MCKAVVEISVDSKGTHIVAVTGMSNWDHTSKEQYWHCIHQHGGKLHWSTTDNYTGTGISNLTTVTKAYKQKENT